MTTFTIDNDNNIAAFGTPEEAAAASSTPFDTFASENELAELAANWPDAVYLIASLQAEPPVLRAFRVSDGTVSEEELEYSS